MEKRERKPILLASAHVSGEIDENWALFLFHQTERLAKDIYDTFATDVSSKSSKARCETSG